MSVVSMFMLIGILIIVWDIKSIVQECSKLVQGDCDKRGQEKEVEMTQEGLDLNQRIQSDKYLLKRKIQARNLKEESLK